MVLAVRRGLSSSHACVTFGGLRAFTVKSITEKRLEQFLAAELTHFATAPRTHFTLEDLLRDASTPLSCARFVHDEIPKHFASRIQMVREIPGWEQDPQWSELHKRYLESFKEMRLVELNEDDLSSFTRIVTDLKSRQRIYPIIRKVVRRQQRAADKAQLDFWNAWFERFFLSRMFTEMLTSQYMDVISQSHDNMPTVTGIVDPQCSPIEVCERAATAAEDATERELGIRPFIRIRVFSKRDTAFSFPSKYLYEMLREILTYSSRATARAILVSSSVTDTAMAIDAKQVRVVICSDSRHVAIRVSDTAGGLDFDQFDHMWDFCKPKRLATRDDETGLPTSRLYAEYLGGSLSSIALPDYGMSTYLFLRRIDINAQRTA